MDNSNPYLDILCKAARTLILALKERDLHTQLHSSNVINLSQDLGVACDLSSDEIYTLALSACFHDVGKIGIQDRILLKPGKLDSDEMEIMSTHSAKGESLVKEMQLQNGDQVMEAVRHHHEHFDGNGYPDKMSGEDIPIFSRIIALADSYDAMSAPRPYHKPKSHKKIMRILERECGKKHDPYLLNKFKTIIGRKDKTVIYASAAFRAN